MRLFCVSDIHVDYKENLEWVERHASRVREGHKIGNDDDGQHGSILLVAGDVCDDVDQFRKVRWWWWGWVGGWIVLVWWWALCVDTDTDVEYSRQSW